VVSVAAIPDQLPCWPAGHEPVKLLLWVPEPRSLGLTTAINALSVRSPNLSSQHVMCYSTARSHTSAWLANHPPPLGHPTSDTMCSSPPPPHHLSPGISCPTDPRKTTGCCNLHPTYVQVDTSTTLYVSVYPVLYTLQCRSGCCQSTPSKCWRVTCNEFGVEHSFPHFGGASS
jgi:hypothetical protein